GRYTDVFTGRIYSGNKFVKMFRDIDCIPVLAKEGAIIPMSANGTTNDCSNPETLELLVYRGNGSFTLYEDDGETLSYKNGEYLKTAMTVKEEGKKVTFSIAKADGDASVVPANRTFAVKFKDITGGRVSVTVDGAKAEAAAEKDGSTLAVTVSAKADSDIVITVDNCTVLENNDEKTELTRVISKFQMSTDKKGMIYNSFIKKGGRAPAVAKEFREPIKEILNLHR
ncbi:MAG: DUF5110 domain-containing protein, partial [Clostridia bacterium]|nr:DUF5110 domain-containing protein [Clostridia bacterium]